MRAFSTLHVIHRNVPIVTAVEGADAVRYNEYTDRQGVCQQ